MRKRVSTRKRIIDPNAGVFHSDAHVFIPYVPCKFLPCAWQKH